MGKVALELAASASRTADGDGSTFDSDMFAGTVAFILDVTAQSGTTPTLDVTIEAIDPISNKWYVIVTFTQVGAATGTFRQTAEVPEGRIRASWDIAGGTPDYTFTVSALGKD